MSDPIPRLDRCFLEAMLIRRKATEQITRLRVARRRAGYALTMWRSVRGAARVRRQLREARHA